MDESTITADERMSWRQICARFPDEWVVIVEADWVDGHNFEFGTAWVFSHHESRRESSRRLGLACREFAHVGCFFTGQIRGPMPRFGVA